MSSERRSARRAPAGSPGVRRRGWARAGAAAALAGLALAALGEPVRAADVPRATRVVAWRELHSSISRRFFPAVAFDPLRRHLLAFGGNDHVGDHDDLWAWDGVGWTRLAQGGPSPRRHSAMVWHSARNVAVMVGGDNGVDAHGDTWLWDGTAWTDAQQRHGVLGDLAEDPRRGVLVGIGLIGTYEWDGDRWTLVPFSADLLLPNGMALGWDGNLGAVIAFGGNSRPGGAPSGDTWAYDGAWRRVATSGPRPRTDAAMAWDPVRSRLVMFGGGTESGASGDVWEWDGSRWYKALYFGGPSGRIGHDMAFDAERGVVVSFGQCENCSASGGVEERVPVVWSWDGIRFEGTPEGRAPVGPAWGTTDASGAAWVASVSFDIRYTDLWRLTGAGWERAPSGRADPSFADAPLAWAGPRLVGFGGARIGESIVQGGRTWTAAEGWQPFMTSPQPPARAVGQLAWDARRQRLVLFGGAGASGAPLGDTWEWDGTAWQEHVVTPSPPARQRGGMLFDPARGVTVLHGGTDTTAVFGDTWEWDGSAWSEVLLDPRPAPVGDVPLAWDAFRERVILYGSDGTWSYDGAAWELLVSGLPLGRRVGPVVTYSAEAGGVVLHGGSTRFSTQGLTDTWLLEYRAEPCTADAQCLSGNCVDGVCCETASCGTCAACNLEASPGRCAPLPAGFRDPDSCAASSGLSVVRVGVCDGEGACRGDLGFRCQAGGECVSGHCVDGVCCAVASCGAGPGSECQSCRGDGLPGVCSAITSGESPGRCEGTRACGADAVCRSHTGEACAEPDECLTGRCLQGFCRGDAEALCEGESTVRLASGEAVDCVPYRCAAGACVAACASTADCAAGFRCSAGGQCVASVPAPGQPGGCTVRVGAAPARGALVVTLVAALALLRRGRRALGPLVLALGALLLPSPARAQPVTWTTLEPDLFISVGDLEWDEQRRVIVRTPWRGFTPTPTPTLEWTPAGGWRRADDTSGPDSQAGHAWHPPSQRVVAFGGLDTATQASGDTWLWDGSAWERARPALAPTPRFNTAMAWDGSRVLLLGGLTAAGVDVDDTWLWDGTTWSPGPRAVMGPISGHSAAWDPVRQRVVVVGGRDGGTWQWDGTAWSEVAPAASSPPTRYFGGLAFDHARGVVVLAGGARDGYRFDDTWELDGSTWTPIVTPEGFPRGEFPMTWNDELGRVTGAPIGAALELYSFDGTTWRREPDVRPPALGNPSVTRDEARGQVVLFGGGTGREQSADTWVLDAARRWTRLTTPGPSARGSANLTFDATRERCVLWGGLDGLDRVDELWTFDGTGWSEVAVSGTRPAVRTFPAFTHFRDRVVLFGGEYLGQFYDDQWEWDGSAWHEVTPALRPTPRVGPAAVWDRARDRLVLFGGTDGAVLLDDTWEWDGQAWTRLAPPTSPPGRFSAAAVWDPVRERVLLVNGGSPTESFTDAVWSWDGTTWTHHPGVPGPRPRLDGGVVFDPDTRSLLVMRGRAAVGDRYFSDLVEGQIHGEPCTDGAACHSGSCIDGVCCAAAACGTCESCATVGGEGACRAVTRGEWDETCEFGLCDGAGVCLAPLGQRCRATADCLDGTCVDGVCCSSARCEGVCRSCATPGSSGVCSAVREADDPGTCQGTETCDAEARCRTRLGEACAADADCGSDRCVLGRCRLPDEAVCLGAEVDRGTLGRVSCGAYTCDGSGQCRVACTSTADCSAGNSCTAAARCEETRRVEVVAESGCATGPAPRRSAGWLAALGAAALVAARRRR